MPTPGDRYVSVNTVLVRIVTELRAACLATGIFSVTQSFYTYSSMWYVQLRTGLIEIANLASSVLAVSRHHAYSAYAEYLLQRALVLYGAFPRCELCTPLLLIVVIVELADSTREMLYNPQNVLSKLSS